MSVAKWLLCIVAICVAGCSETSVIKPPVDTVGFLADLGKIDSQSVEILVQTAKIEGSIGELATQQKRIADSVETLKASLVESQTQKVQEVINSSRITPDDTANDSHPATLIVAESGAVRLYVSLSPDYCPPCYQLKRADDAGKFYGFDVKYDNDWKPYAYPAIRYPTALSPTGWAVMYGYDSGTIRKLRQATNPVVSHARNTNPVVSHQSLVAEHNRLHGGGNWTWPGDLATHLRDSHGVNVATNGGAPVGAIFPHHGSGQIASQRSSVRSVSRWVGYGGRSRNTSRVACPSGGCP